MGKQAEQQPQETKAPEYVLEREIIFQGKTFRPKTVTQEELAYLAQFPDEVPFLKIL